MLTPRRSDSDSIATALAVSTWPRTKSALNAKTKRDWQTLSHLMGSAARVRILVVLLLTDPDERIWLRHIGRAASVGFAGLYRELDHLILIGMVKRRRDGGALYFEVDEAHPLVRPLRALLLATRVADEMVRPSSAGSPRRSAPCENWDSSLPEDSPAHRP